MQKARSTRCGGRLVRYGAKGAKVMPGTPKGDAYCARSLGQMRDHPEAAADPCSPLRLSRKRWACKGAKSVKTNPSGGEEKLIQSWARLIAQGRHGAVEFDASREDEIPSHVQYAYKLVQLQATKPAQAQSLFDRPEDGPKKAFPFGKWIKAEVGRPMISGPLALRPGFHAIGLPVFDQGRVRSESQIRAWVLVEMPAFTAAAQAESDSSPLYPNGQREGIRNRLIGPREAYNYKTNPNASQGGVWPIAGSMRLVRFIDNTELRSILESAGKPAQVVDANLCAFSDEQIARLNSMVGAENNSVISMKKNPPDSSIATVHNPDSLIAPNPTPFGEVIFDDEDEIMLDEPKRNAPRKRKTAKSDDEGVGLLAKINNAALFLSPAMLAADPVKGLANLRQAVAAYIPKASTKTWKNAATKFLWWLDEGCPFTGSESFKPANKMVKPEWVDKLVENEDGVKELKKVKVKRTVFSVYGRGNSKLPYVTFSTLPGITCPGAGVCLTNTEEFPGDENKERKHKGGWCYSFKAWRYPAAYFRQLGNTLMVKMPRGRQELARLFGLWAEQEAVIKGGETIRLYVDGDIDSETTLEFWMNLCARHPHVRAYGYSKSWTIFLSYGERLAAAGKKWPSNYTLNLSEGSKFWNNEKTHSRIMQLPITRHDFGVVKIEKDDGKKIPQNIIDLDGKETGVYPAIARLEKRVNATAPGDERDRLQEELDDWKKTAALLETTRGAAISQDDDGADDKPKAYIEVKYVENGVEKTERKAISVPDEFWSRNPEYTKAVTIAARNAVNVDGSPKYPKIPYTRPDGTPSMRDSFFVCPGKCGNCLGNGRHACGEIRLKQAIVIGLH